MEKQTFFLVWSWIWLRSIRLVCCRYLTVSHYAFGVGVVFNISMCWKQWFCLYIKTSKQRFDAVKTELPLIPLQIRKLFRLFFGLFFVILALFSGLHTLEYFVYLHGTPFKIPKSRNFTYFLSSRRVFFDNFHSFYEFCLLPPFCFFPPPTLFSSSQMC